MKMIALCLWKMSPLIFLIFGLVSAKPDIRWCTISGPEQEKCLKMSESLSRWFFESRIETTFEINCIQASSKPECMQFLDTDVADLTSMDPGDLYTESRNSLVPISQVISSGSVQGSYSVAVIKRGLLPDVRSPHHLRGKKACFGGVGVYGSWVLPIHNLMRSGAMKVSDCNNHVKSATEFFGTSCAPNSLVDIYNPLGDNSDQLCRLCIRAIPGERCTSQDPYAGYQGAFQCLVDGGDVAFLKHSTVRQMVGSPKFEELSADQFELLCPDGKRRSVDEFEQCNWGKIPDDVIVTSSARTIEDRRKYQMYLQKLLELFGGSESNQFGSSGNSTSDRFRLFESVPRYGSHHNLLLQDDTVKFRRIGDSQTYRAYLRDALRPILEIRWCPVPRLGLCTTSNVAHSKCRKMKIATDAQLLKPELFCVRGESDIHCMEKIHSYEADAAMFDANGVYTAGDKYGLIPILSEVYTGLVNVKGQTASVTDYGSCNLGKVKANALVTRGGTQKNDTEINAYISFFMHAQHFYGKKSEQRFSLFISEPPHTDVIFQDATQTLQTVPEEQRDYRAYLGEQFLRDRGIVDCTAEGSSFSVTYIWVIVVTLVAVAALLYWVYRRGTREVKVQDPPPGSTKT